MKKVVFLLVFALCAILGLTLHTASAAPPPATATHVAKPAMPVLAVACAQTVTADISANRMQLHRSVVVSDELAPTSASCRFNSVRRSPSRGLVWARPWRNLHRPAEKGASNCPFHIDPGRQQGVTYRLHDTYLSADSGGDLPLIDPGPEVR